MIKFPSIEQFRNVSRNAKVVFQGENPALDFRGTVKLHGTNAAIVVTNRGCDRVPYEITYQSRNNVITPDNDNAGFARFMSESLGDKAITLAGPFLSSEVEKVVIYGEWCGAGIQRGVAITELEKMFVIFAVKTFDFDDKEGEWVDISHLSDCLIDEDSRIFNSEMFQTFDITVDMSNPELSINDMVAMTEQVEAECPVGKYFGVSGVGEGIVWRCQQNPTSRLWFKVKGEKHSVTKVKKLVEVDAEKLGSIAEFVDRVVTDNRVLQGIDYLKEQELEVSRKSTGQFLSWFFADIMKEEADVLEASGLTKKDVSSKIGEKARGMFFATVDFS